MLYRSLSHLWKGRMWATSSYLLDFIPKQKWKIKCRILYAVPLPLSLVKREKVGEVELLVGFYSKAEVEDKM